MREQLMKTANVESGLQKFKTDFEIHEVDGFGDLRSEYPTNIRDNIEISGTLRDSDDMVRIRGNKRSSRNG